MTVEVSAPTGSYALTIDVRGTHGIRNITVNGKTVPQATTGAPASVRVVAFSPQGSIPITVGVPADADIQLALVSYRRGLDTSKSAQLHPRPGNLTTAVHEVPDAVIVTKLVPLPR